MERYHDGSVRKDSIKQQASEHEYSNPRLDIVDVVIDVKDSPSNESSEHEHTQRCNGNNMVYHDSKYDDNNGRLAENDHVLSRTNSPYKYKEHPQHYHEDNKNGHSLESDHVFSSGSFSFGGQSDHVQVSSSNSTEDSVGNTLDWRQNKNEVLLHST